jgi:hypothetical protein
MAASATWLRGFMSDALAGVDYALDNEAKVPLLPFTTNHVNIVRSSKSDGCINVAGYGNSGNEIYETPSS